MSGGGAAVEYRPLRAPRRHGEALLEPALSAVGQTLESNIALLRAQQYDCQGLSLARLKEAARARLLQQARQYTTAYRDVGPPASSAAPILASGHQPQLYHPGVWFKNFALSLLGQRHHGHAIHLLVDNDTASSTSIRVPSVAPGQVRAEAVAIDRPCDVVPYEERGICSPDLFRSFGDRVQQLIQPLIPQPIVSRLWPLAVEASRRGRNLGECVAAARHTLEGEYGLDTLELPLSRVCDESPFRWFTVHLLAQLPRFRSVYNESLADFRQVNRIRSRTHPVPDLQRDGSWLEAPFWLWSKDDPRRRRLFVRTLPGELELTDRAQHRFRLPLSADSDGANAVEQLKQIGRRVKLRPRALITTLFARLVLADLFLHGIGGAKYDQLTDLLMARFFDCQPTEFLTLTATVLLPITLEPVEIEDLRRIDEQLRQLRYHPEKHAPGNEETNRLAAAKQKWIETLPPRGQRLERHRAIESLNLALQPFVSARREDLLRERSQLAVALREKLVLGSREYSFCLFPDKDLPTLLLELLGESS